ncbi:outer membrane lipoprotein SlyB [Methylovorus glucosotrophus]|uniref:17 kDa surface antigen n=2 Tax=Methylovorus glucosotrophus TaxID=266009 RepID=C6X9X0_METGS|nr:glycine zipper 2TM domain-containing protein [Methylovorus glucosotrophus]ACT51511.1 17 kDa surface antigen [Methylovorus glucosotrophus SIP3-4]KAF0843250.1 outer membrane lipoprotein SlyB [Methylovorus glucosotrophus]
MNTVKLVGIAVMLAMLGACASSNSGSVYSRDEARKVQTVKMGVVESVRTVKLEGTKSPVGTAGGAVVGGVAGSTMGGGKGQAIATVLGAIVGGLAGSAAEEGLTRKDGLEITVKLDSGTMIAVVQEADDQFQPGERVRILESGGTTRVSH